MNSSMALPTPSLEENEGKFVSSLDAARTRNGSEWASMQIEIAGVGTTTLCPANQYLAGVPGATLFARHGTSGMSSESLKYPLSVMPARLANLWVSKFALVGGEQQIEFLRSGTPVHFGEKDPVLRREATMRNVEELISAARAVARSKAGEETSSLRLLTIDLQGHGDRKHAAPIEDVTIHEKVAALLLLARRSRNSPQMAFSVDSFVLTNHESSYANGHAWNVVKKQQPRLERFLSRALARSSGWKKAAVESLLPEIRSLLSAEGPTATPLMRYALGARVAMVGALSGSIVHINCRSGKDRTGLLDVEMKFLLYQLQRRSRGLAVSGPAAPILNDEREVWQALLLRGGNDQIQKLNSGFPGYKLNQPLLQPRIGQEIWKEFLGLSRYGSG